MASLLQFVYLCFRYVCITCLYIHVCVLTYITCICKRLPTCIYHAYTLYTCMFTGVNSMYRSTIPLSVVTLLLLPSASALPCKWAPLLLPPALASRGPRPRSPAPASRRPCLVSSLLLPHPGMCRTVIFLLTELSSPFTYISPPLPSTLAPFRLLLLLLPPPLADRHPVPSPWA